MNRKNKTAILFFAFFIAFWMTACTSKEAVLLEEEEMVLAEESSEEINTEETAAQTEGRTTGNEGDSMKQVAESTLFIHMCGAVKTAGVYELAEGSRVYDAVLAAGGFTEDAYQSYVNLAMPLEDGMKVEIPTWEETESLAEIESAGVAVSETTEDANRLINLNTASKEELCTLSGIGESRADAVIEYREKNGGFSKIEDIMNVEGIKEGMFSRLKDKICVK